MHRDTGEPGPGVLCSTLCVPMRSASASGSVPWARSTAAITIGAVFSQAVASRRPAATVLRARASMASEPRSPRPIFARCPRRSGRAAFGECDLLRIAQIERQLGGALVPEIGIHLQAPEYYFLEPARAPSGSGPRDRLRTSGDSGRAGFRSPKDLLPGDQPVVDHPEGEHVALRLASTPSTRSGAMVGGEPERSPASSPRRSGRSAGAAQSPKSIRAAARRRGGTPRCPGRDRDGPTSWRCILVNGGGDARADIRDLLGGERRGGEPLLESRPGKNSITI